MESGLYPISVNNMVNMLSAVYVKMISEKTPFIDFPSVMLWGPPGVGKSQGIREIAENIEKKTQKKVVITDVRLMLFNPVDLRGIPSANADKTLAVWLKPHIFEMDSSEGIVNILFLDEISAAPPSVQSAAYQITLDRMIGEHQLPDNCIVIAAGNRVSDRSVAYNMPKALANRLCHLEIKGDYSSWHNWAIKKKLHHFVVGYLDYNSSALMRFNPEEMQLAFPTPRSWEMVSNILNHVSENIMEVYPLIAGCIGDAAAYELRTWSEVYSKIPKVETVFNGTAEGVPARPEILFALSSEITMHSREHHTDEEIRNVIDYASQLPVEFRNRIFTDLLQIKGIHRLLSRIHTYDDWFLRSGRDWEDYGL